MNNFSVVALTAGLVITACIGVTFVTAYEIPPADVEAWATPASRTMRAFRSDSELRSYFRAIAARQKRIARRAGAGAGVADGKPGSVALNSASLAKSEVSARQESVTNVQHAGVDEGGIVKVHGNYLVVLRRGRLFTVAIGGDALKPISIADAFGPDINPEETWYDEMLVSEDTIAVIGYSYDRGGTEVGLFKINDKGQLSYQFTYHLRSNDYYSSRNYASRLIGNKLIFYTPSYLAAGSDDPLEEFPAVRRWHKGAQDAEFKRIVPATRIYRPEYLITSPYGLALHTLTVCDLANGGFDCEATGVVGPAGRVFYVSPTSVYVWMTDQNRSGKTSHFQSLVYRLPLDGSAPTALRVSGSPVDQFSFLEDDSEQLSVLVRSESAGDGMWSAEPAAGDVALLRVRLSSFSDGREAAAVSDYLALPKPTGYTFQNRFVGDYLLYGTGSGWGAPEKVKEAKLYAVQRKSGKYHVLKLVHGVDRLEALNNDAVVVGIDGEDLHFTAVQLGETPQVEDTFSRKGASQGELRSHGFFYKPDDEDSGTIGLPISVPGRPGYHHLFEDSAAVLFLRNESLHFERLGELAAQSERAVDDRCRASCVDWYGNARPLYLRGRVFALLGYEIVEGTILDGRLQERRRINYAPKRAELTRN
ncbi:MAG: beta-propeller domain-containing protein [Pyrinomonadaceae bacterium]